MLRFSEKQKLDSLKLREPKENLLRASVIKEFKCINCDDTATIINLDIKRNIIAFCAKCNPALTIVDGKINAVTKLDIDRELLN